MMVVHDWMPLVASKRLTQIQESLERLEQRLPKPLVKLKSILVKGLNYSILVVSHCRCLQLGTSSSKILDNKPGFELCVFALNV